MKKNLLLIATIATTLASCSKTEVVDRPASQAIGFTGAYIGGAVESRAASEITRANIDEFTVYGGYHDLTHVFDGIQVTGTAGQDNWNYGGTTRYWVAGSNYKFAAYAPKEINGNGEIETSDYANGHLNFKDYVSDPAHQHDLIYDTYAITTDDPLTQAPDKIQFVFEHLLSMIKFTFKSGFGNDIKVTVDDLSVSGMISQGTYTGSTGIWTAGTSTVQTTGAFSEMASNLAQNVALPGTSTNASSHDFAVIPQKIASVATDQEKEISVSFSVRVQDSQGGYIIGSAEAGMPLDTKLPAIEWKKGNRYNYNVTISGSDVDLFPIEFGTPDVTPITDSELPVDLPEL